MGDNDIGFHHKHAIDKGIRPVDHPQRAHNDIPEALGILPGNSVPLRSEPSRPTGIVKPQAQRQIGADDV